jgi:hypothetical protein
MPDPAMNIFSFSRGAILMRMSLKSILAAGVILACSSAAFAEQIDNPAYTQWAKFKEGTTVTTKSETDMAGNKSEMEITKTLTAISADKATIETKMTMINAGTPMALPAQSADIPAKIDKPATPAATDQPKPDVKEGTDTVDVAGKSVSCKTTESTMTVNGMNIASKTWMSDDVPGSLVKMESTTTGAMSGTTKMAITAMTIK